MPLTAPFGTRAPVTLDAPPEPPAGIEFLTLSDIPPDRSFFVTAPATVAFGPLGIALLMGLARAARERATEVKVLAGRVVSLLALSTSRRGDAS